MTKLNILTEYSTEKLTMDKAHKHAINKANQKLAKLHLSQIAFMSNNCDLNKFQKYFPTLRQTLFDMPYHQQLKLPQICFIHFREDKYTFAGETHLNGFYDFESNLIALEYKYGGLASLVHEYGHFLDKNASKILDNYDTDYSLSFQLGCFTTRQDKRFNEICRQSKKFAMPQDPKIAKLGQYKSDSEIFARAFEIYIAAKYPKLKMKRLKLKESPIYTTIPREETIKFFNELFEK